MLSLDQRAIVQRVFFTWVLIALVWRGVDHALLVQLEAPVLGDGANDLAFWLAYTLGIPQLLTAHPLMAGMLDATLLGSALMAIAVPRGSFFPRIHCAAALLYFITFTTWSNHHYRPILGLLLAGVPFMFRDPDRFNFTFRALRYYTLFIYTSAGLYKVFRGSWLNPEQMTGIIEGTQLELFLAAPDGWHAQFFTWLLEHQTVSWLLFTLATVLEVVFIVGYFTRRYDLWMFATAISLHIGFWFTMRFFAFELIVLDLALLPWGSMLRTTDASAQVEGTSSRHPGRA